MTKTAFLAAAAACAFSTAGAGATPISIKTERVTYTDLDLGSKAGQATLVKRLRAASKRVCLDKGSLDVDCYEAARADAVKQAEQLFDARQTFGKN